ncbi:MAG: SAM-dependent DNA methyltransferase, partial [bacterium]|nr:SAM-dependent DNA methyltransferase [bacterium]
MSIADEYLFLHPHIAYPDIYAAGGFDVVVGNPPWGRIKLQEKKWFAHRNPEIAAAPNKAARARLIKELKTQDPRLYQEFRAAKRHAERTSGLIRSSDRYPLSARGDINTYQIFADLMRTAGRWAGMIVPSGIASDDQTKHFFNDLVERRSLVSLYDFENRKALFPSVHRSYKFCLLTVTDQHRPSDAARFVFFAHDMADIDDPEKNFSLTPDDLMLVNPNTRTAPTFRTRRDAEITTGIYRRVPVLIREGVPDGNPWQVKLSTMYHMSNDSYLFRTRDQLEGDGWTLLGNHF